MAKTGTQRPETAAEGAVKLNCPYCQKKTPVIPADDYRPIYVECRACGKRFIAERVRGGIEVMKLEAAPPLDDPDRREIELGQGDEE
ncbi:MAG: hypothetical protein MUC46_06695 [Desulfobacterales bacterium]|nr:hypothetical protein [Desulfobacterales bacterium]